MTPVELIARLRRKSRTMPVVMDDDQAHDVTNLLEEAADALERALPISCEDDEMVSRVEEWLETHPMPALPASVRDTLSDCAEFLADIDGDLARRCEAAMRLQVERE